MKTIIALLTTTMLVAGASSAMADQRPTTDDAPDFVGIVQALGFDVPFAWALAPIAVPDNTVEVRNSAVEVRNSTVGARNGTVVVPGQHDFQLGGR